MKRRRHVPEPVETHCRACRQPFVDVICADGTDRKGCARCELEHLVVVNFRDGALYLERKPEAVSGDAPPCPRCERPYQHGVCAACGYPAARPGAGRRRLPRSQARRPRIPPR